jgi:hypothetical protein
MPRYLISLTQENARRLEAMLGGRIEIVPSQGPLDGVTGERAVVSGLDAITDEEYGPIGRRLSAGCPLYHAGGPGRREPDHEEPALPAREEGKCPDGRECVSHCGRPQRACSRQCQVCQRLAWTDSTRCPACPDAPSRTGA